MSNANNADIIEVLLRITLHEKVVATEKVVEINRGVFHKPKIRYLVLSLPTQGSSASDVPSSIVGRIHIIGDNANYNPQENLNAALTGKSSSSRGATASQKRLPLAVKRSYDLDHIVSMQGKGATNVSFDFGSQGQFDVSFESGLQRDVFLAATRKHAHQQRNSSSADGPGFGGDFAPTEAEELFIASLPAELSSQRFQKRKTGADGDPTVSARVLTTEDETILVQSLSDLQCNFSNMPQFNIQLKNEIEKVEECTARELIKQEEEWNAMQEDISETIDEVDSLEERVEHYSYELLNRRHVIETIEHQSIEQRRLRDHLKEVSGQMDKLMLNLTLPGDVKKILNFLFTNSDVEIVKFLDHPDQLGLVSKAMHQMEIVLQSQELFNNFHSLAAIDERKEQFRDYQRKIVDKVQLYVEAVVDVFRPKYLYDPSRWSSNDGKGRISWLLHSEVYGKLQPASDVLAAMQRNDIERFTRTVRHYSKSLQPSYAVELRKFFQQIRIFIQKLGWKGSVLLGDEVDANNLLKGLVENNEFRATSLHTPHLLHSLTPMAKNSTVSPPPGPFAAMSLSAAADNAQQPLFIQTPDLCVSGRHVLKLHTSTEYIHDLPSLASADGQSFMSAAANRVMGDSSGGKLRPDLAFALILETVMDIVLYEEQFLKEVFHLVSLDLLITLQELFAGEAFVQIVRSSRKNTQLRLLKKNQENGRGDIDNLGETTTSEEGEEEEEEEWRKGKKGNFSNTNGLFDSSDDSSDEEAVFSPKTQLKIASAIEAAKKELNATVRRKNTKNSSDGKKGNKKKESSASTSVIYPAQLQVTNSSFLDSEFTQFVQFFCANCDGVYILPALAMLEEVLKNELVQSSVILLPLFLKCSKILEENLLQYSALQFESISKCSASYSKKNGGVGLFSPLKNLSVLANRLESMLSIVQVARPGAQSEKLVRGKYDRFLSQVVKHIVDALDGIALKQCGINVGVSGKMDEGTGEVLETEATTLVDPHEIAKSHLIQFRHAAFLCVIIKSSGPETQALLDNVLREVEVKRDRSEALYLQRLLFAEGMPEFYKFLTVAEDLVATYSPQELAYHKAVSQSAIRDALKVMEKEIFPGVKECGQRLKKHLTRGIQTLSTEEAFHQTLLQTTWAHFGTLLEAKVLFMDSLLTMLNCKPALQCPISIVELRSFIAGS